MVPMSRVEVVVPDAYLGDVIADLTRRQGRAERQERRGDLWAVTARVPQSEMADYALDLGALTQGQGTFTERRDVDESTS